MPDLDWYTPADAYRRVRLLRTLGFPVSYSRAAAHCVFWNVSAAILRAMRAVNRRAQ